MGAEFELYLLAMVGQVAADDAVLKHAAERQPQSAGRPGEPPGDDVVGADEQRRSNKNRGHAACDPRG
jgi:hypothetical protein